MSTIITAAERNSKQPMSTQCAQSLVYIRGFSLTGKQVSGLKNLQGSEMKELKASSDTLITAIKEIFSS
jgi:hypothetical protein